MQRLQGYKFELKPNGEQQRNMHRFAGSCRFVFNKALALQKERHEQGEKKLGYAALCRRLTEWKAQQEMSWLSDARGQALQQALKNLERAYRNFFARRADFPRFKKKGQSDSFRYPQGFRLDQSNSRIFLPRLGWRFISIQTECEVEKPIPESSSVIGIDMGVTRFATLSDGTYCISLKSFRRQETALRKV